MVGASVTSILLYADGEAASQVRLILEQSGLPVHVRGLSATGSTEANQLVIVDGQHACRAALDCCRRLRAVATGSAAPLLLVLDDAPAVSRSEYLVAGADVCFARPFAPEELLAQVRHLLRFGQLSDQLIAQTAELHRVNERRKSAYQQLSLDLDMAARLRPACSPRVLPAVGDLRCAVSCRPSSPIGSDCYDLVRLGDERLAIYLADTMGHGVGACLLAGWLNCRLRSPECQDQTARQRPDAVLDQLNRELIELGLPDVPFISLLYGLLDGRDGSFCFARAGQPVPVRIPCQGSPEPWPVSGGLLGVCAGGYAVRTGQLQPGDKLLMYTDGLDSANDPAETAQRLQTCAGRLRALPIRDHVLQVSQELLAQQSGADDFTLLGIEWTTTEAQPPSAAIQTT